MNDKFRIKPGQQVALQKLLKGAGFEDKAGQLWAFEQLSGRQVRTLADATQNEWRVIRDAAFPDWTEEDWTLSRAYAATLAGRYEAYLELMGQKRLL